MNNPVKIIHIITGLDIGGAEQMLKRLLLSDLDSKNNVLVISLNGVGPIGVQLQEAGFNVQGLTLHSFSSLLPNFWRLFKLIRKTQPELVQTWMYHADFFGGLAARMARCRNVVWGIRTTSVPHNNKRTYWLMRLCAILSYVVPKKIICVADAARDNHISYGYHSKKMVVVHNGFDFSNFNIQQIDKMKVRNELGLIPSDFVIGCVGRLHLDKGQDIFIKAVALLQNSQSPRLFFLLIGRGCDKHNLELQEKIASLGLTASFILLGERYDIPECLAAMDAFCMPSRTEGFPNGLGEAMAMGLPCVATNVGDTRLLTSDKAVIVSPDDPVALADGLSQIITMSSFQRKLLGRQAANRVRNQYSIDKARDHFYELYQETTELIS